MPGGSCGQKTSTPSPSPKTPEPRAVCPECGQQLYDLVKLLGGFGRGKCLIHGVQVARLG